jgi:hypothetical protein
MPPLVTSSLGMGEITTLSAIGCNFVAIFTSRIIKKLALYH